MESSSSFRSLGRYHPPSLTLNPGVALRNRPLPTLREGSGTEWPNRQTDANMKAAKAVVSRVQGTKYSTALSLSETKFGPGTLLNQRVKPYDEVPGPKQLPLLGNAWRFLPFVGKFLLIFLFILGTYLPTCCSDCT